MTEITPARGFDFHCHVDLLPDPAAAIASCDEHQIVTLAVTTTPKAYPQNRRWTAESQYVHAAVGLHPELAGERHDEIALLETLIEETPFIGEVGLDGSPGHRKSWLAQTEVFLRALLGAQRLGGRVVSIHSRRAAREVLNCISEQTTPDRVLPILHWFSDSLSIARQAVSLGCYFSVNQRMFAHASGIALLRGLPTDRLLSETDAPFTSEGKRSGEPLDVTAIASELASLRGDDIDVIRSILAQNASRVFAFAGIKRRFDLKP
jgi:TatD DNase family protein